MASFTNIMVKYCLFAGWRENEKKKREKVIRYNRKNKRG